ncbi:YbgC/FadM family acyl-CoA thioesterase [Alphaproteobacteria bacterium]|nr:YbgC/FadM family acyl-CoA thioesterase [Alphaproteobacteria bacterium]
MKNHLLKSEINNIINGEIINSTHHYFTRIFYEDTDAGGIVYHANYLKYFERARTSLLNLIKIDQKQLLEKNKLGFVVRNINLRINKSFQLNQILLVKTCLKSAKKSCIVLKHEAYETIQKTNSIIPNVACEVQIVMIDDKNKVRDISAILDHPFFKNI